MELLHIAPPTPRIVRAVGHAYVPGHNTINMDLRRFFVRQFCKIMYGSSSVHQAIQRMDKAAKLFGFSEGWRERICCFVWNVFPIGGAAKGGTYETGILQLLFNATGIALIADNTATTPLTNLFVALHTADPGTGGNQQTNEATYTLYARVSVARTNGGWTVTGTGPASCSPVATISFPAGTGGSGTVTNFSVGSTLASTGVIYYSGTVTPNIVTGNGVTPQLTTASTITES